MQPLPEPLRIESSERGLLVGQTGCGKSTLAQTILEHMPNLVVIDAKHHFETIQPGVLVYNLEELKRAVDNKHVFPEGKAVLYRPPIDDLTKENMDAVYKFLFEHRNLFIYNDELTTIVLHASSYPNMLRAIHTQGRQRNVGVLNGTQRPSQIPSWIYTETDVFWKGCLTKRDDAKRMSEYMGETVLEPDDYPARSAHSDKHSFYHYRMGERRNANQFVLEIE
jgi:ABC-type dipeptide/oligopeptide/nickel transport system ATPase component